VQNARQVEQEHVCYGIILFKLLLKSFRVLPVNMLKEEFAARRKSDQTDGNERRRDFVMSLGHLQTCAATPPNP